MDRFYRAVATRTMHRGVYELGARGRPTRSRARASAIAAFVGWDAETTIFTRNATEAINLVAYAWGREQRRRRRRGAHHRDGAPLEHRALADALRRRRAPSCATSTSPTTASCRSTSSTRSSPTGRVKLVAFAHVSNVLGTINPVAEIAARARAAGAVDRWSTARRRVPQMPVDVGAIGADFYAWTGHKALGPDRHRRAARPARAARGDAPVPRRRPHDLARRASTSSTWNELPWKFEAGTSPIAEAVGPRRRRRLPRRARHGARARARARADRLRARAPARGRGHHASSGPPDADAPRRRGLVRDRGHAPARHRRAARPRRRLRPRRPPLRAAADALPRRGRHGARLVPRLQRARRRRRAGRTRSARRARSSSS